MDEKNKRTWDLIFFVIVTSGVLLAIADSLLVFAN